MENSENGWVCICRHAVEGRHGLVAIMILYGSVSSKDSICDECRDHNIVEGCNIGHIILNLRLVRSMK